MNTYDWCLRQGEKGLKHKGLRKVEPEPALAFSCVEYHIANGLQLEKELVAWIRKTSQQKDAKELREEFQYGVEVGASKDSLNVMEEKTKEFIYKTEVLLDKLQKGI